MQRGRYLGSEHPDFGLEGSARSVVQFQGVLPEATSCVVYAPIDLDGQVGIHARSERHRHAMAYPDKLGTDPVCGGWRYIK